jgi:hypothetical protein
MEQARRKKKALMTPAIFMDRTELGTASSLNLEPIDKFKS